MLRSGTQSSITTQECERSIDTRVLICELKSRRRIQRRRAPKLWGQTALEFFSLWSLNAGEIHALFTVNWPSQRMRSRSSQFSNCEISQTYPQLFQNRGWIYAQNFDFHGVWERSALPNLSLTFQSESWDLHHSHPLLSLYYSPLTRRWE